MKKFDNLKRMLEAEKIHRCKFYLRECEFLDPAMIDNWCNGSAILKRCENIIRCPKGCGLALGDESEVEEIERMIKKAESPSNMQKLIKAERLSRCKGCDYCNDGIMIICSKLDEFCEKIMKCPEGKELPL